MSSVDISQYAVGAESIDILSQRQIETFFWEQKLVTKDECDRLARSITKSSVSPRLVQNWKAYTVATDADAQQPKAIQFQQAQQTYGDFVPGCTFYGKLEDVYVYEMSRVPGIAFCRIRRQLLASGMEKCMVRTVRDFARFFASAWIKRPVLQQLPAIDELFNDYCQTLDRLAQSLPTRFQSKLDEVRQGLHLLFRPSYPMVANHTGLLEMNIYVDEQIGGITGIVGWAASEIAPFGTSLGGLETVLGVQTSSCWHFHPLHNTLRAQFWEEFYGDIGHVSDEDRRAIEIARMFGLFQTHGFEEHELETQIITDA
ncbi:hypothetical protein F4810DRAFT_702684 [Camillea tinctor]|nr:hypothetical protein F4810DRAFT_702684 [Camillea tinctor]